MLEHSPEIGTIAAALAAAQGEFEEIKKDTENPFFKSKYAPLVSVIKATRKALTKYKIAVIQHPELVDGKCVVTTMLIHESGQWIKGDLAMPVNKMDAQGMGSATTYGRRYGRSSMLDVAADDDDDGNAASKPGEPVKESVDPEEVKRQADLITGASTLEEAKGYFRAAFKAFAKDTDAQKFITSAWEGTKQRFADAPK